MQKRRSVIVYLILIPISWYSSLLTSEGGFYGNITRRWCLVPIYTADHTPIWASHTNGHNGSHLEVQDDGNVVIYTPDQKPIWATGTQGR